MIDRLDNNREKAIRTIKIMLFSASIVPSLLGGALSYYYGSFDVIHFILVALALFIGQAGGDYLYYYFTHRHTDTRDSHTKIFSGWRPLFTDILPKEKGTLYAGIFCLAIDFIIGVYFTLTIGYVVIALALLGGLVAIFFTPLMLKGYKEPVIFLTFGPLCLLGVYFVLTGQIDWTPVVVSLPIAFLVTVVAFLKGAHFEIKEQDGDAVILKLSKSRILLLTVFAYLSLIVAIVVGAIPLWGLLGFLSLPISIIVLRAVNKEDSYIKDYLWAVVRSIYALVIMGLTLSLSFII